MEQEFQRTLPADVSVHVARIRLQKVVVSELLNMRNEIRKEAVKLADANVDVIGFGCTTGSLVAGAGYDNEIVELIMKVTHKPAVATAGAVVQSLKALGLLRISVATPYTEDLNKLERRFLEQSGFSVDKIVGLGLVDNLRIAETKPEALSGLVKKANTARAEGTFISCTNLPTLDRIAALERALKKPVVSSNTATLWAMMKQLGKVPEAPKLGKLFVP